MTQKHFHLAADISKIRELRDWLEFEAASLGADEMSINQLLLSVDELVTNTIEYGYKNFPNKNDTCSVDITLEPNPKPPADTTVSLVLTLSDSAIAFDPFTEAEEPDIEADLEDRPIGGLGVHIVTHMMDESTYRHDDGKNIIRLVKHCTSID